MNGLRLKVELLNQNKQKLSSIISMALFKANLENVISYLAQ
jgi:hypothetical protein